MLRMLQGITSPFQEQATLFTDMFMAYITKKEMMVPDIMKLTGFESKDTFYKYVVNAE